MIGASRRYIRSKCWRSKAVLTSPPRQQRLVLVPFLTLPIDYLLKKLEWLDHAGEALKVCVGPDSPVELTLQRLTLMVLSWSESVLKSVFMHFGFQSEIWALARKIICSLVAQLFWHFMDLKEFPLLFAGLFHHTTRRGRKHFLQPLYDSYWCSLGKATPGSQGRDVDGSSQWRPGGGVGSRRRGEGVGDSLGVGGGVREGSPWY